MPSAPNPPFTYATSSGSLSPHPPAASAADSLPRKRGRVGVGAQRVVADPRAAAALSLPKREKRLSSRRKPGSTPLALVRRPCGCRLSPGRRIGSKVGRPAWSDEPSASLRRSVIENPTACANIGARGIILAALVGGDFMALGSQPRWTVRPAAGAQVDIDVGLRDYMLRIYNYMASGLALTGIVAYLFAQYLSANPALAHSPVMFLIMLAPLGLVMWLSFGINR